MLGIRPVTPGTLVVAAGTILLVLVSVSTPILKSIFFLEANIRAGGANSGQITLGVWGYCAGSTCSNTSLGYSLNADQIFGVTGLAARTGLSDTLVKGLTYALVLHPIAAGFGLIATLCGILAHIREFAVSGFATCFASMGATVALIAFIFDIVIFVIAKKRIEAASGTAVLGNAIWMTLVGMLCLMFSGCFFGVGRCLIRNRRPEREASEKSKPTVDAGYGQAMRQDAINGNGGYGQGAMYGNKVGGDAYGKGNGGGGLPAFQQYEERNGEIIPLTAINHADDSEYEDDRIRRPTGDAASLVSGVGMGYGRRTPGGFPVSLSDSSGFTGSGMAGTGAGGSGALLAANRTSRLGASESNSTISPFVGMHNEAPSPSPTPYDAGGAYPNYAGYTSYANTPQPQQVSGQHPSQDYFQGGNPSADEYGYSNPSSRGQLPPPPLNASGYPSEKMGSAYYTVPPSQQQQQQPYASSSSHPAQTSYAPPSNEYQQQYSAPLAPPPVQPQHTYESNSSAYQPTMAPSYHSAPQQEYAQHGEELPLPHFANNTESGYRDSGNTFGEQGQQGGLHNPYEQHGGAR